MYVSSIRKTLFIITSHRLDYSWTIAEPQYLRESFHKRLCRTTLCSNWDPKSESHVRESGTYLLFHPWWYQGIRVVFQYPGMREAELEMSHWTQAGGGWCEDEDRSWDWWRGGGGSVSGAEHSLLVLSLPPPPSPPLHAHESKTRARTEASRQCWLDSNRQIFLLSPLSFLSSSVLASFFPL